jgi:hypothetical protein
MAHALQEQAEAIMTAYLTAGLEQGDWRTLEALGSRVHGRPVEKVESKTETAEGMSLDELRQLGARLLKLYPSLQAVE